MPEELNEGVIALAQSLPSDMAIMKLENENIQALAAARPRSIKTIRAEIVEQLEAFPEFAAEAIYEKPVGTDERGKMKYARNLSIRAAEALAEAYGYCRVRSDIIPIDDDHVKVEATFTDYQKGRIWQDSSIVSKWYRASKRKGGHMVRHQDDRFYNVILRAEASKRLREVITRSVPPGLRAELFRIADQAAAPLLTDEVANNIVAQFTKEGITLEQIETVLGRRKTAGWTEEDRKRLKGLWVAIRDGESTKEEIFGGGAADASEEATDAQVPDSGASIGDLAPPKPKTAPQETPETAPESTADEDAAALAEAARLLPRYKTITECNEFNSFYRSAKANVSVECQAEITRLCEVRANEIRQAKGKAPKPLSGETDGETTGEPVAPEPAEKPRQMFPTQIRPRPQQPEELEEPDEQQSVGDYFFIEAREKIENAQSQSELVELSLAMNGDDRWRELTQEQSDGLIEAWHKRGEGVPAE